MLGILAELLISALLLWLFGRHRISVLGLWPDKRRMLDLVVGFLLALLACSIYHLSTALFSGNGWTLNEHFTARTFFASSGWTLNSVLFEELIFRGALLYLIIQKNGVRNACIASAACFGIYHWFSYGAFGNPMQMLFIFLLTGAAGIAFAFAYGKTNSLYMPIGLHFGWNLVTIVVFSKGPLGPQLLLPNKENELSTTVSLISFAFQLLALPLLSYWYLKLSHRWDPPVNASQS